MVVFDRMLSFGVVILAATMLSGTAMADLAAAGPSIGKPAPDFSAVDSAGRTHRLSDYRGKRVILEWTNHDCPFVSKHYRSGNMQQTQMAAAGD
ncbi:MAG: redoxin domain-containing protein, partial [Alphaproteobacteria bacterium]|nr:redoxin domain-containing protein [Alphaproteobacteria bacterium]